MSNVQHGISNFQVRGRRISNVQHGISNIQIRKLVIGHWIFGFAPSSLDIGYSFFSFVRSVVAIAYICPASFTKAVAIIETSTTVPFLAIRWV